MKEKNQQQLYTDKYFESGHILLKIRQTIVAIIGWFAVIIPIVITVTSFWASFNPKIPHIWSFSEGIYEIKFIGIILVFAWVMTVIFSTGMTIIQNRKRARVVEQWPTFNPIDQKKRKQTIDDFIDQRFGDQEFRENVRSYDVQPEQNLETHEIQKLYAKKDLDEVD
ncbi:hypothetical protein [Companilactobacillus nantensis]|uniref:Uncharacterized protein n=1 Tax=Companilactobacillus nantensis DSM 16982 TaxID=1423774 RepID=A0A0R1WGN2_9LACO|nr:hypothetical protein [Companilactobacillus nantensis]KRM17194.1 hypothetical protein FD31_GL000439 [Companilactobacillus nantensis DSM 16982]GEO64131.1 hypothetical protein LNA01_13140 [Companilactobacillus nantensis]